MLTTIPIFLSILFGVLYPMGFWVHSPDPIVLGFRRFNLGLSSFVGGVGVVGLFFLNPPLSICYLSGLWLLSLLLVTAFFWNKENVNPKTVSIPVLIGVLLLARLHPFLLSIPSDEIWINLISGGVFCGIIFATVLGHWYLNVPGLPLIHLFRAIRLFASFLLLRAIYDILQIVRLDFIYAGDTISILQFMQRMDGFLLWVAFLFGTVFPFFCTYFVHETLKVKNTQSATGILYAILIAVFMGEITYKYYLFRFGLAL